MMASSYYQNLIKRVLEASTTDNWEIAVREWDIVDCEEDEEHASECVCGKENLRYLFTIRNRETGSIIDEELQAFTKKNETNPYYIQLLKVKMDKYFGKKNVTNVKECLKEGTVYGPLCAYRLFYVGCSRAKRNLVIMINKKDIEGFEDKLRNKLMITGFNVL